MDTSLPVLTCCTTLANDKLSTGAMCKVINSASHAIHKLSEQFNTTDWSISNTQLHSPQAILCSLEVDAVMTLAIWITNTQLISTLIPT